LNNANVAKRVFMVTAEDYTSGSEEFTWVIGYTKSKKEAEGLCEGLHKKGYHSPCLDSVKTIYWEGFLKYLHKESPPSTMAYELSELLIDYKQSLRPKKKDHPKVKLDDLV